MQDQKRWYALAVLCLSLFIVSVDNTVMNLALPSISTDLGASASQLQWITSAYTLVFATVLLTTGTLGDRYGRKLMLQAGLVAFGAMSLGAALSHSTGMLILFRGLLGLAAAMMMPATLSIITNTFRDPKERSTAIAIWTGTFAVGAAIGPVIGGYLLNHFNWDAVFFINLPIVTVGLIGGSLFVMESRDENAAKIDYAGALLSMATLLPLIYGIIEAGEKSWHEPMVPISIGFGFVMLAVFVWWELRADEPMLPLAFFKNRAFTGSTLAILLNTFGMLGALYFLSQYMQTVLGYTPLGAAVRLIPTTFATVFFTMLATVLARRIGSKFTIALGISLAAVGLFILSAIAAVDTSYSLLIIPLIIFFGALGMIVTPATDAIMSSVPRQQAGVGSAVNDMLRELGGSLGIAVFGSLMNARYLYTVGHLPAMESLPADVMAQVENSIQTAHQAAAGLSAEQAEIVLSGANQAFVDGMSYAIEFGAFIMLGAALVALILIPRYVQPVDDDSEDEQRADAAVHAVPQPHSI